MEKVTGDAIKEFGGKDGSGDFEDIKTKLDGDLAMLNDDYVLKAKTPPSEPDTSNPFTPSKFLSIIPTGATDEFKDRKQEIAEDMAEYKQKLDEFNGLKTSYAAKTRELKNHADVQIEELKKSRGYDQKSEMVIRDEVKSLPRVKDDIEFLNGSHPYAYAKIEKDGSFERVVLDDLKKDLAGLQTTDLDSDKYSKNTLEDHVNYTLEILNSIKYVLIDKMDNFDYLSKNLEGPKLETYIDTLSELTDLCETKYNELNKSYGPIIDTLTAKDELVKDKFAEMRKKLGVGYDSKDDGITRDDGP